MLDTRPGDHCWEQHSLSYPRGLSLLGRLSFAGGPSGPVESLEPVERSGPEPRGLVEPSEPEEPLRPVDTPEPGLVDTPEPGLVDIPEPDVVKVPEPGVVDVPEPSDVSGSLRRRKDLVPRVPSNLVPRVPRNSPRNTGPRQRHRRRSWQRPVPEAD
jgi:hypothetical protein